MSKVLSLSGYRRKNTFVHFDREELGLLLQAYGKRVARGEWRDYAMDQGAGMARFTVFRHAHDRPLFTIAKQVLDSGEREGYLLARDGRVIRRSRSLRDILAVLNREFRLV